MGLDACVRCNCYREGKAKAPAFDESLIVVDEDYITLSVPYGQDEELWRKYRSWKESCCEHRNMEYADEHVGNWAAVREFQEGLIRTGKQYYPVLLEYIPDFNGGILPAELAKDALAELEVFRARLPSGSSTILKNVTTGEELFAYIAAYDGLFSFGGREGYHYGVDPCGFFICRTAGNEEVFRSMHFIQKRIWSAGNVLQETEFIDIQTGAAFQGDSPVDAEKRDCEFRVVTRESNPDDYSYVTHALTILLKASLATGNPIVWG